MELEVFKTDKISQVSFSRANQIANEILDYSNQEIVTSKVNDSNIHGSSSQKIQKIFEPFIESLGFQSEKKGLFKDAPSQLLRPDFYKAIAPGEGIIFEVERGKVTINNMDLLDFWKCHLCTHANILFLMVPCELHQNHRKTSRKEFNAVRARLSSFFIKGNETNVEALFLFGY